MQDKYGLVAKGFIPPSKYWSSRLGFLDIINDTKLFIPLIEKRKDVGDDLKVLIKISKEWRKKNQHYVGEAGALFRLLQFASWKFKLGKIFIKDKTLLDRKICDNPEIINWPIAKLLELDNETPQWASAAILIGNQEKIPDNFFLNLSREALDHYNKIKNNGGLCELRYDETIRTQAEAFIDLLKSGQTDFKPKQQDDYCFARAFDLINKEEGEKNWPELKGHESNRLEEMEKQLTNLFNGKKIDSRDHRVVYSIAMLAVAKNIKAKFSHPNCVSKSWPQFWKFLKYAKNMKKPITYSTALVIYNNDRSKYFLTRRPLNDESMPGYWGFPAASKENPAEPWEETANRAAKLKLGVEVKIIKLLGEDTIDRGKYILILRDYEVEITKGEPQVPQNFPGVTQYIEQKWTDDPTDLKKAARDGSLCSRIFLRANNIDW